MSLGEDAAQAVTAGDAAARQRIVDAQRHLPPVEFSMLLDREARVLAHSDLSQVGRTLDDLPATAAPATLATSTDLVDVVAPVPHDDEHVGWARAGVPRRFSCPVACMAGGPRVAQPRNSNGPPRSSARW